MSQIVLKGTSLGTLNDLMDKLESEIDAAKSGAIDPGIARIVLGNRKAQLEVAKLGLQYIRIIKPRTGSNIGPVPILPGAVSSDTPEPTSAAPEVKT